jgi:hypothetical protein
MRRKITGGRKAGKDHARSQCPEEHPGTHCCLRQEARPTSSGSEARKNIRGSDAAKSIAGSEARWCEEVMPGGTSGEVMRRKITGGSDADACAPG